MSGTRERLLELMKFELEAIDRGEPSFHDQRRMPTGYIEELEGAIKASSKGEICCSTLRELNDAYSQYGNSRAYRAVFSYGSDYEEALKLYRDNPNVMIILRIPPADLRES